MKDVRILGPGCKRCDAAAEMVKAEAAKIGIEVQVEKSRIVPRLLAMSLHRLPEL
jgi:hypothetical protein